MTTTATFTPSRQGSVRNRTAPATRHARPTGSVPRLRYIVVVLAGIFAIFGVQLMLSIAMSSGAYEIAALKGDMRTSQQELQIVAEDINALVAPSTLAGLATAMGMVADNNPAYLKLSTGEVVGEAVPASGKGSSLMFAVTGGGDTPATPAIVEGVLRSVALAEAPIEEGEPVESTEIVVAPEPSTPVTTTVVAPTQPLSQKPAAPVKRFGGSIPSPVTR